MSASRKVPVGMGLSDHTGRPRRKPHAWGSDRPKLIAHGRCRAENTCLSRPPGQYPGLETGSAPSIWEMSGQTTDALAEKSPATHTPRHLAEEAGELAVLEGA